MDDWKTLQKKKEDKQGTVSKLSPKKDYIGGADFDVQLDELAFNRVLRFKNLDRQPQGNDDKAKVYWDKETSKLKMWFGGTAKWVDIVFTSTSTSTTSSSSSSTSTSTTSSSTNTT